MVSCRSQEWWQMSGGGGYRPKCIAFQVAEHFSKSNLPFSVLSTPSNNFQVNGFHCCRLSDVTRRKTEWWAEKVRWKRRKEREKKIVSRNFQIWFPFCQRRRKKYFKWKSPVVDGIFPLTKNYFPSDLLGGWCASHVYLFGRAGSIVTNRRFASISGSIPFIDVIWCFVNPQITLINHTIFILSSSLTSSRILSWQRVWHMTQFLKWLNTRSHVSLRFNAN